VLCVEPERGLIFLVISKASLQLIAIKTHSKLSDRPAEKKRNDKLFLCSMASTALHRSLVHLLNTPKQSLISQEQQFNAAEN